MLICRGELVLRNPTIEEVADCLGLNAAVDVGVVRDMLVIGGGPGGAGRGGVRRVRGTRRPRDREPRARRPGRLELEDRELPRVPHRHLRPGAGRAGVHPGREVRRQRRHRARGREARCCERKPFAVELATGDVVRGRSRGRRVGRAVPQAAARAAGGVRGRRRLLRRVRDGGQLCDDEEVVVVGGGNSAGQAAMFLARDETAAQPRPTCTCWCAAPGLADSMSRYLIQRIEESPRITLRTRTEIDGARGRVAPRAVRLARLRHRRGGGRARSATSSR